MARIAFYSNNMVERGTPVALYDYAVQSEALLGHESVVLYDRGFPGNNPQVIQKFAARFDLIPCDGFTDVDAHLKAQACDLLYVIKSGKRDDLIARDVPTMAHAVFATTTRQVHGAAYAYVSEWLSQHCSAGRVPWVPHMVQIGQTDADMRAELGIPTDALVFGCYGGAESFDIPFVKTQVIPQVLETRQDVWFIFMNITAFADHTRLRFLPGTADLEAKTAFINTCDAMLHARARGETFGLAVGEFSLRRKPVLTFGGSKETAHLGMLGAAAQVYHTPQALYDLIDGFDRAAPSSREAYLSQFAPAPVMQRFADHLITPARKGGLNGARDRLGWRRWDPLLMARPKLRKLMRGIGG
ncbi:MAG: hypothetical protein AAF744_00955 [Pseudomonadota bacterium]